MQRKPEPQRLVRPPKALTRYQLRIVAAPWYEVDPQRGGRLTRMIHTFCKARQIGGSEAAATRALCFLLGRRLLYETGNPDEDGDYCQEIPMSGVVISKDWRGAKELLGKIGEICREWADAGDDECRAALPHIHDTKIFFPTTGTVVKAVGCSPTAIRGSTGFVILDEFAFARSQEDIWGAAKSLTDPNLGRDSGHPMLVVSSAWEAGSFAHRIFTDPNFPFSKNRFQTDIYEAVADGFPINIDQAFRDLGIDELIETEYKCRWTRGGESFFSAERLRNSTVDDDPDGDDGDETRSGLPLFTSRAPLRLGIDCGGGVGRDFTAAVMWRQIAGKWWMTGCKASNSLHTVEMADVIADWLLDKSIVDSTVDVNVRCDRSIMGADFIRHLDKRLAERTRTTIMGVGMSPMEQESYAIAGRKILDRGHMVMYLGQDGGGDRNGAHALMLELGRIKARLGQGGHVAFSTPRDPLKGHCDRAWAGLIGLEGAELVDDVGLTPAQEAAAFGVEDSVWGRMSESRGFG